MKKGSGLILTLAVVLTLGGCVSKPEGTAVVPEWGETANDTSGEVRWEYTPAMSSRYPAMPFSFDTSHQKIMAVCSYGTLIDFEHFDSISESYPQGKSITVQDTEKLYWAPWDEEEDTVAASAEVMFTVWDDDGDVLYEGTLAIVQMEETGFGKIYSATLEEGSGLTLMQDEYQLGGTLTRLSS